MSLAGKIAQNTSYQIFGKIAGTIIGLITIGLMTRYLGVEQYGFFTVIVAFMQFFGTMVDFGLQMTTSHLIAKYENESKKIFQNIFTLRLISSIVFLSLATLIGWLAPYPLIIKQGITIISLSFLFISLQSIFVSVFQKNLDTKKIAISEIISRIVLLIGVYIIIQENFGLLPILWMIVLGNFASFLYLAIKAKRYYAIGLKFDTDIWKKIYNTAWPLAISIGLTLVYFRADTIILSFTNSAEDIGIYGAAYKVLEILINFPYLFVGLILPLLAKTFISARPIFNLIFQKSFDFMAIITIPMVFATLILGEKIMTFIAGAEFILSGSILKILIFAVAAIFFKSLFGYAVMACELQKKMLKFYLIDAIVALILYLIFIPIYGLWAAAVLTAISEGFATVASLYILKKHIGQKINLKIFYKSIIASMVMALILIIFISANLLALIIIGLIIYFWMLYLLKGISKNTVSEIFKTS